MMKLSVFRRPRGSVILLAAEAVFISLLFGLLVFHYYRQRVEQIYYQASVEAENTLLLVNDRIGNYIRGFGKDIGLVGRLIQLAADQAQTTLPEPLIESLLLSRPEYRSIRFFHRDGGRDYGVLFSRHGQAVVRYPSEAWTAQAVVWPEGNEAALPPGTLFVSALRLDKKQYPPVPVMVFHLSLSRSVSGDHRSLQLEINATGLLDSLRHMVQDRAAQYHLINDQGQWLMAPDPAWQWGGAEHHAGPRIFADFDPQLWRILSGKDSPASWSREDGSLTAVQQSLDPTRYLMDLEQAVGGVFMYHRVDSGETPWRLIALINRRTLAGRLGGVRRTYWPVLGIFFCLLFLLYLIRYRALSFREQSRKNLELAYNNLERLVEQRARALTESNRQLAVQNEDLRRLNSQSEEHKKFLQEIIDSLSHPFFVIDPENKHILLSNKAARSKMGAGATASERLQKLCAELGDECPLTRVLKTGQSVVSEYTRPGADGQTESTEIYVYPVGSLETKIKRIIVYLVDITERHRLQEQFIQAQKMEAVGQLAGGIAHDFNNLLSVMIGYSEQLVEELSQDNQYGKRINGIHRAALKAGDLTQKLLLFSRKHPHKPKLIDINSVIAGLLDLVRPIIGVHVSLEFRSSADLFMVMIDPSQFEQVIMNLLVNARDAMPPQGGQVILSSRNVVFRHEFVCQNMTVQAGPHVMIGVQDNGSGMDKSTMERIYEPFFTTKREKEGTGLGLSTVYGIVKQHGGFIHVGSRLGQGTRFRIYLPARTDQQALHNELLNREKEKLGANELILLVDDDRSVREMISVALVKKGYRVMSTGDGQDALRLLRDKQDSVRLVLSDVVMPRMSGVELASRVRELCPRLPILLMSGYMTDQLQEYRQRNEEWPLIQKPFAFAELFHEIRQLLDSQVRAADGSETLVLSADPDR